MTGTDCAKNALAGSRLLLVEDDDGLREELRQFLEGCDICVQVAADIGHARAALKRQDFDLVLMDLWLKQENGFDFLRDVRRTDTPCLIMTAQDNVAKNGLSGGTNDYILKPLNSRELLARLSTLLHAGRSSRQAMAGFLRNQSGAVSIVAALSIAMLVAIAAIVIDAGSLYYARRNLQATSDAAALAAVQNPTQASAVAASVFSSNGYSNPGLAVSTGVYVPDESRSVPNRFTVSSSGVNAVRVRATVQQPTYFSAYFGLGRTMTLVTQSTAARVATASFAAGTGIATLNAGILNSVLSQLWGSNVSLSLIDYQSLLGTNIQALPFLNQLATDIGVSGNYQQLANTQVTIGQILNAATETVGTSGEGATSGATVALKSLLLQLTAGLPVTLSNVMDFTPLAGRTIGGVIPVSNPSLELNLMSILSASLRTEAGGRLINVGTTLTIPVTNSVVSTRLAVGNQMVQLSMASPGATINTAQIRLAVVATLANINLGVVSADVQVPIFLQAASGQATLVAAPCTSAGDRARVSATSGLASLQFGTVTDAALQDFSVPVTPVPVPVVGTSLLGIPVNVNIAGSINVAQSGPVTLDFTQADIDAGTVKSLSSATAAPFSLLSTSFNLSASIAGIPLLSGLLSALNPLVASLIAPLDAPVSQTLATLGLALGDIDVRVFDVSCRTPTLVG